VTPELRDLINHLLVPQEERYDAEEALNHEWIKKHEQDDQILSASLPNHVKRVKKFQTYKKLKKIILTFFCSRLQDSKLIGEADIFAFLDKNNDGVLSIDELKTCIGTEGADIQSIYESIDADKNGVIDYTEWLAAAKDWSGIIDANKIKEAFNTFDINSDGEIGWEELKMVLGNDQNDNVSKVWKEVVAEVDSNGDGKIDFDDFKKLFESKLNME
jgi:calcium-dependent protein kinase